MKNRYFAILTFLPLAFLVTGKPASADETQPGVGRISMVSGEVSTQRGDSGDWVATTVNAPVAPGDQVSTGARSRAEIQLDYANILRLDQSTLAKVADLSRTRIQVQVAQGLVNFDVLKGSEAETEIDTPSVAIRPLGEGRYRIQVNSNSQTLVTVREGEAEISTPQGSTKVKKGDLITIEGTDNPQYQIASAPGKDDWDNWNKDRDHAIEDAESWQHTNRYYAGTGDLDRYGHWEYVPGYDYVWAPYAGPGWVPYSTGNWVWEPYWGWTWVSYEPWGWAPYHYGRWFCWGNSWVWWPGPVYAAYRPVWAPAYVSFFGFGFGGGHWGFNFGFGFGSGFGFGGSIGWLPINPDDRFFPWYGRYGSSYNVTNITNITNIANIRNIGGSAPLATARQPMMSNLNSVANNARVRQGLTTVPAVQFGRGSIAGSRQAVTPEMLKQGQFVAGRLPVVPTRESLSPVKRPVNSAALPAHANANQHFFTRTAPPAGPTPFTQQAAQVRQMIQQKGESLAAGERGTGTPAPEAGSRAQGAQTTTARGQGNFSPGGMATPEAKAGSTSPSTGQGSNRSPSFGNQSAGQFSKSGAPSRTPSYDNEALSRLPESGFGRSGNQPASQKPQGSPSAQSGTVPGPGATSQSNSGWRRFGDGSQPNASASRDRAQAPATAERAQPRTSAPGQSARPGWQSFAQGGPARGSGSPQQGTSSRPAFQEPGSGGRSPSRSETPSYGQPQGSFQSQPGGEREFQRPGPNYNQPQGSYGRPLLQIRKPIVTERTPRSYNSGSGGGYGGGSRASYSGVSRGGYNGGYRGGAPSGSHGFSSSGSHSGGHGRR